MIAALLLLAGHPAVPAAAEPPSAENDIVIIGQRVRKVKFTIKTDRAGHVVCRIKRSSGDPEIDGLACEAARGCVASRSKEAMIACLTPRWEQIPAQIAARRRARATAPAMSPIGSLDPAPSARKRVGKLRKRSNAAWIPAFAGMTAAAGLEGKVG
jgi:hypothetical protein